MKKILTLSLLMLVLLMMSCSLISCGGGETITLNVYNWGEYISDGSEDSLNVNKEFEQYYYDTYGVKLKVNYTTYASNEDMYAKLKSGATSYDVIIPSDYMIERMITDRKSTRLNSSHIR